MAVVPVDTGTATYNTSATTQNFTFTIGATATLAVALVVQDATQSVTSVTWDPAGANQAFTLIGSEPLPTSTNGKCYLYGLVNPTAGASKTLRVINGVAAGTSCEMQSYSGTVTSSVAASCTNALVANGTMTSTPANIGTAAQSGANGDMYVGLYGSTGTINSVSDTSIDATAGILSPAGNDAAYNRFASTGSSHALTAAMPGGAGVQWAAVSCDIVAAGGAAGPIGHGISVLQGVKRASYI